MQQELIKENSGNKIFLYIFLSIFILVVGIEVFGYFRNPQNGNEISKTNSGDEVIQIDVLNGCGVSGVGQKITDHLRKNNYDVVASSNYKNYLVNESFIIDRIGDEESSKRLANAMNIDESKIIREINPSYFVSFSIVVGKNFKQNLIKKEN